MKRARKELSNDMFHDAERELVKKLRTSRLFPGIFLKVIVWRTKNATTLTKNFLSSTDYHNFNYTHKYLENQLLKFTHFNDQHDSTVSCSTLEI